MYGMMKELILLRVPEAAKRFETLERGIFGSSKIPFENLSLEGRLYHMDENCEAYHRWLNYSFKFDPKPDLALSLRESVSEFTQIDRKKSD